MPGVLFVDKAGRRVTDTPDVCSIPEIRIHMFMGRPGHCAWAITDSKEGWVEDPEGLIDYEAVRATSFETLDDVAEEFGIDAEGLKQTAEEWSAMVAKGTDDLYGIDLSAALPLDTPPYHAVTAPGSIMSIMGRPVIDERFRVLDDEFAPIEGLYAIGNACSGFWGPDYIQALWDGSNKTWCAVSGYLVGKDIAAS